LAAAAAILVGVRAGDRAETTDRGAVLPAESSAPPDGDPRLRFPPPQLDDPVEIVIDASNADLELDPETDYVLRMPEEPLEVENGLRIAGGRNVVLIGGEIHHPRWYSSDPKGNRGLYLVNQTGIVHIEGLLLSGALSEGINLSEERADAVQLQNVRVESVRGSRDSNHADVVQTWAGPRRLLVDGLTGATTYQGLFLLPTQHADVGDRIEVELHRVDIKGEPGSGYLYWIEDEPNIRVTASEVWASPRDPGMRRDEFLWWEGETGSDPWQSVRVGSPPTGSFVRTGDAGVNYRSPGYRP